MERVSQDWLLMALMTMSERSSDGLWRMASCGWDESDEFGTTNAHHRHHATVTWRVLTAIVACGSPEVAATVAQGVNIPVVCVCVPC